MFPPQCNCFSIWQGISEACLRLMCRLTAQLALRESAPGCPELLTQCPGGRGSSQAALHFYWSAHTAESSGLKQRTNTSRAALHLCDDVQVIIWENTTDKNWNKNLNTVSWTRSAADFIGQLSPPSLSTQHKHTAKHDVVFWGGEQWRERYW